MTYKAFARIIKAKREKLKISQKDFAKLIPINKSSYCKIENGNQEPNFIILQRICYLLQIDLTTELKIKTSNPKEFLFF